MSDPTQGNQKILIGGRFYKIGGVTRNCIARLNPDGSLDAGFNPNIQGTTLLESSVDSIVVQADGKILLGGGFIEDLGPDGSLPRPIIAWLNPDGSAYTAFGLSGLGGVNPIAVQADGKILVGCGVIGNGYAGRKRIARLNKDGSLDTGFGPDADNSVDSIVVQADGKILVGGYFKRIGGVTRNYMARLNADGSLDAHFDPSPNDYVHSVAVQADGKVLTVGGFTSIGTVTRKYVARLNTDGSLDKAFNPNVQWTAYAYSWVGSVVEQADGKILVGGGVINWGDENVRKAFIARLNADGSLDTGFNDPNVQPILDIDTSFNSVAVQADQKILIGGPFNKIGGVTRNCIARLNPDGSLDTGFNPNIQGGTHDSYVNSIAVQTGGKS